VIVREPPHPFVAATLVSVRTSLRLALVLLPVVAIALADRPADARSSTASTIDRPKDADGAANVTVYGATWCGACKGLEATLRERGIPFDLVDVDQEPARYEMARKASGTNAIPLSNIVRGPRVTWIVGNDPDAVERAYKGD
jgi:glutaredoxin